jgi:long-chain acyl-CoA synthetase
MRNSPEWIVAFFAICLTGATAVLINSRGAPDEIGHALRDTDCVLLLADPKRADAAAAGFPGKIVIADDAGNFHDGSRALDIQAVSAPRVSNSHPDDPAIILFTSGTTGRPKGAVLSHRSIYHSLFAVQHAGTANLIRTAKKLGQDPQVLAASASQRAGLAIMPFFHVSGAQFTILSALTHGGKIVLMNRWDTSAALELIARERINQLTGPPAIFWDILSHPARGSADLSSLTNLGTGGQATPPQLLEALVRAFPHAAPGSGWGMTETNGSIVTASGEEWLAKPQSAGRLLAIAQVRIVDEHGGELSLGGIGEIWVKSVLVMTEYCNQPEATRAVLSDGWLRTGDVGLLDAEGYLTIVDRKKDMIICRGENIYCAELERVFNEYPGVFEAAAFGVPDERLGERAVVAVVPQSGSVLTADDLSTFARKRLADYKVPAEILVTPTPLVRNALGKIDRVVLRKSYGARAV